MSTNGPIHRKASIEEYHDLPWQLGYKHEYYGEKMHVSVNHSAVVTLRLTLRRHPCVDSSIRPLRLTDARKLFALYRQSLNNVPEYIEWSARDFLKRARKAVRQHLKRSQQPWYSAARLAHNGRRVVAAAFIADTRVGPILQPIFVRPSHVRQGLGTLLMNHVENRLLEMGATHLYSNCHLANGPSLDWHHRYGFVELPDLWVASHRFHYYRHELERRSRLGQITEEEVTEFARRMEALDAECKHLEALQKLDYEAAHPVMMF